MCAYDWLFNRYPERRDIEVLKENLQIGDRMEKVYNTICEDCGTVFKAKSKRAFMPQVCKRRISESHKNKN